MAAPVDDEPGAPVVEGYIDLAVLDDRGDSPGLVIVDYKTDAVADDADRALDAFQRLETEFPEQPPAAPIAALVAELRARS